MSGYSDDFNQIFLATCFVCPGRSNYDTQRAGSSLPGLLTQAWKSQARTGIFVQKFYGSSFNVCYASRAGHPFGIPNYLPDVLVWVLKVTTVSTPERRGCGFSYLRASLGCPIHQRVDLDLRGNVAT